GLRTHFSLCHPELRRTIRLRVVLRSRRTPCLAVSPPALPGILTRCMFLRDLLTSPCHSEPFAAAGENVRGICFYTFAPTTLEERPFRAAREHVWWKSGPLGPRQDSKSRGLQAPCPLRSGELSFAAFAVTSSPPLARICSQ